MLGWRVASEARAAIRGRSQRGRSGIEPRRTSMRASPYAETTSHWLAMRDSAASQAVDSSELHIDQLRRSIGHLEAGIS